MEKSECWPKNHLLFAKELQAFPEEIKSKNLNFIQLDESTFHEFMITFPVFNNKSNVIICSPVLYPLSLFLLSEFASIHAVFTSDCGLNKIAEGIRRMPVNGKITFTRSGRGSLTLPEFRILHLWIQGISMKDIAGILGISLSTVYVYRKKLSQKMQFMNSGVPAYKLKSKMN